MTPRPSWPEARARAFEAGLAHRREPVTVPLGLAGGRVLAVPLDTGLDIPHFASSAMDGWAVRGVGPWRIAGSAALAEGEARRILTGGVVGDDVTAVLRDESAIVESGLLSSAAPGEPRDGQHIRTVGGEARRGERLIEAGTLLNPAHLALAASAGADTLIVRARPRVDLLVTGDELVAAGMPTTGRVRDGFGVQLPALLGLLGGDATEPARVPDRADATVSALRAASAPLVVTTGGTGGSDADHLRPSLVALGARLLIDGIAMRPGGPTLLAEFPDGRLLLGLPGNPLAAMTALLTVGTQVMAGLAGGDSIELGRVPAGAVAGREGTTLLIPYAAHDGRAAPSAFTGAGMTRGLASAEGLLVVPPRGLVDGDAAETVPLPW